MALEFTRNLSAVIFRHSKGVLQYRENHKKQRNRAFNIEIVRLWKVILSRDTQEVTI